MSRPSLPDAVSASAAASAAASKDAFAAVRNFAKLGGSAAFTMLIAIAVRFPLRRYLGPETMGPLEFAEAFAAMFFVALNLGVDTYIRKEVPVRPAHASDFFGSVMGLRLLGTVGLTFAMGVVLTLSHYPPEVQAMVYVFGLVQLMLVTNQSLAAMLQSVSEINGFSVIQMVSKAVWGLGILLTLVLHRGLIGLPLSLLVAEGLKAGVLFALVRKHLSLKLNFHFGGLSAALVASLPFYLNTVAHTIYNKLDVSLLDHVSPSSGVGRSENFEVAWYSAASGLAAQSTMFITPFITSVLMPLFARAAARSDQEYVQLLRRTLELILIISLPCSLALGVGADFWMQVGYGPKYAQGTAALQVLAPIFVLTYVAMVSAVVLILDGRGWSVTLISIGGLLLNPLLNWLCIRPSMAYFGPGGGGVGCALAQLGTEAVVTFAMMLLIGQKAFDRRTLTMVAKTLLVCAAVVCVDRLLHSIGPARIALDALAYCVLIVVIRAIAFRETIAFVRLAFKRRHEASA